jgi:threonine aldolase
VSGEHNVERLRQVQRDFRSDTVTIQSDKQMLAALRASRGDDVFGEDPATRALEERVARMCGKEEAMFTVSGTLTNRE